MAIQSFTPDPQDLASLNAFRLLCPVSLALPDTIDDEMPDDVSGPIESERDIVIRHMHDARSARRIWIATAGSNSVKLLHHALRESNPQRSLAQPTSALDTLCKRNC